MIQSMTGFGKATAELPTKKITVEIKSLNSKQLDLSARIPSLYKEKEMEVRNLLSRKLERGKVDFSIYVENLSKETATQINQNAIESYYNQINESSTKSNIPKPTDWYSILLRLPEVLKHEIQELDEEEWKTVQQTIDVAISQIQDFRVQEGEMLKKLFETKIVNLSNLICEVEPFEEERIEKVRARILETLQKIDNFDYDKNRLEQEMIYYIEKLDINEEKTRLRNHLEYFVETIDAPTSQGKKLGFIAQEIGREINTMGSKSNHAEMQRLVVQMKDELEQIKEQVLNVL